MKKLFRGRNAAMLLILVGLSIMALTFSVSTQRAQAATTSTQASATSSLPPPTGVTADAGSGGSVTISWKSLHNWSQLGGYMVYRNATRLAQVVTTGHGGPTTYTDSNPPAGSVTYSVAAYNAAGVPGKPSPGFTVEVTKTGGASTAPTSGAAPSGTPGSTANGATGASLLAPNTGGNSPTAFERYGKYMGSVHNSYGVLAPVETTTWEMIIPVTLWAVVAFFGYMSLSLLTWAVTKKFYAGLIIAVNDLIQAIFHLSVYSQLEKLAWTIGAGFLVLYMLRRRNAWFARGLALMVVGVAALSLYAANSTKVVTTVMNAPLAVGGQVLKIADAMATPSAGNFGLKTNPTFNGDPVEQAVRDYINREFVAEEYPGFCEMNFGSEEWATRNYVPNSTPSGAPVITGGGPVSRFTPPTIQSPSSSVTTLPPAFRNLTYCQFYAESLAEGGAENSYLQSAVQAHATGQYDFVWQFFQGNDFPDHLTDAILLTLVIVTRSLLICLLAFSLLMGVVMLGIGMIKMCIVGMGLLIPPAAPVVTSLARRMVISAALPAYMAGIAVISLWLSSVGYSAFSQFGWAAVMVYQFLVALACLVTAGGFWHRRHKDNKERTRMDGISPYGKQEAQGGGGSGTVGKAVELAAVGTAAVASGGTAAALAAGTQSTAAVSSTVQRPAIRTSTPTGVGRGPEKPAITGKVVPRGIAPPASPNLSRPALPKGKS